MNSPDFEAGAEAMRKAAIEAAHLCGEKYKHHAGCICGELQYEIRNIVVEKLGAPSPQEAAKWAIEVSDKIIDEIKLGLTENIARALAGQAVIDIPAGKRIGRALLEADKNGYERGREEGNGGCCDCVRKYEAAQTEDDALLRECEEEAAFHSTCGRCINLRRNISERLATSVGVDEALLRECVELLKNVRGNVPVGGGNWVEAGIFIQKLQQRLTPSVGVSEGTHCQHDDPSWCTDRCSRGKSL